MTPEIKYTHTGFEEALPLTMSDVYKNIRLTQLKKRKKLLKEKITKAQNELKRVEKIITQYE